jgi:hypothetical protein
MLMSGVLSFSLYRSSAAHQETTAASPSSATIRRPSGETGRSGSSWSSVPAT